MTKKKNWLLIDDIMIYTVTLNPSLDYIVGIKNFVAGSLNRSESEKITAGGKGINVSIVLHNLGMESTALGFTAGFTGRQIESILRQDGIKTDFINVEQGLSRINVKILHNESGMGETEINGSGPLISKDDIAMLFQKFGSIDSGSTVVLAGSVPSSLPKNFYVQVMNSLKTKNIKFIVDASGELLKTALPYHPFLVKPNLSELEEIFEVKINSMQDAFGYAKKLLGLGAQNALVSLGKDGAILSASDGCNYYAKAPSGKPVNTVGSGDSMVAGFIAGYESSRSFKSALERGVCAGSAAAFSSSLASKDDVELLLKKIPGTVEYRGGEMPFGEKDFGSALDGVTL